MSTINKELRKKEKALEKKWKHLTLPLIKDYPEAVDKLSKRQLLQADQDKLILKYTGSYDFLIFGFLCSVLYLGLFYFNENNSLKILLSPFGIVGLWLLVLFFTMPKKYWVFNRRSQIVTVPGRYYKKGHDIPVDEMRIETRMSGSATTGPTRVYPVAIVPSNIVERILKINIISLETLNQAKNLYKLWSYYTWYMDENRPLPPGKIFDHCREREFKDRKKRGFPMPMYYSLFPTPEANETFQNERDLYWTDEMLCPDVNKYGECCLEPGKNKMPKGSVWYHGKNNPENWEDKKFIDIWGGNYAPEVKWIRYIFEDGRIVYTKQVLGTALVPPKGTKYETEYFRSKYIDIEPYYERELQELREKEGVVG